MFVFRQHSAHIYDIYTVQRSGAAWTTHLMRDAIFSDIFSVQSVNGIIL